MLVCLLMLPGAVWSHAQGGNGGQRRTQNQNQTSSQTSPLTGAQTSASTVDPFDLTGRVLNARTNAPIARALVKFGQRAVLTNHDGVFSFPQVTSTSGQLVPAKQGFYTSASGNDGNLPRQTIVPGTPVDLLLYPEAVLSGIVANAAGEGLPNFAVSVRRSSFDETGHHWMQTGFARTDTAGAYRVVLPSGDYVVQARSFGRPQGDSEMYLPVSVPADSTSIADALHVKAGEQVQVNLRPEERKAYVVSIASDSDEARGFPQITAYSANGLAIQLNPIGGRGEPGSFRVLLPNGTFRLAAFMQSREGSMEGEAQVTVAGHDVSGVVMHYSDPPRIPVELTVEPSVSTTNLTIPTARSLGLNLVSKVTSGDAIERSFGMTGSQNQPDAFSVPNGTYRLQARTSGQWYLTGADYGGTNLLTDNLVMSLGGGAHSIHLRISNQTATVSGTVTLGDQPMQTFLYLIATGPSVNPVVMFRSNGDGTFNRSNVPPGSYRILAAQQRLQGDLLDPLTMSRYLGKTQTVTLTAGVTQTVALQAVATAEIPQ